MNQNENLPKGRSETLGSLLYYLYKDLTAKKIKPDQRGMVWFTGAWRNMTEVVISSDGRGHVEIVFWQGEKDVTVHTAMVPNWVADRAKMVWVECSAYNAENFLREMESAP